MIKPRAELEQIAESYFKRVVSNPAAMKKYISEITKKYGMPYDVLFDYYSLKRPISDANDFILYTITDEMGHEYTMEFFSNTEISRYSSSKYLEKQIKFPIKLKMVEVVEGSQWIGKTSVQDLMLLSEKNLIKYNENTQRTLTQTYVGGTEIFKISINKNAIKEIQESYRTGMYIPNTITLNLPEDTDFYYSDGYLVIKEIENFDIVDGYHRFVAMSKLYNEDKDFDYPMELRITCHSESKARQFIFQEDQKTKMKKIDSESYNQNNPGNQVVSLLNQESIMKGLISQKGLINDAEFSVLINAIIFKNKKVKRSEIIKAKNDIKGKMNILCENEPDLLDQKWATDVLASFVMACELYDEDMIYEKINEIGSKAFSNGLFKNPSSIIHDIPRLKKLL